MEHQARLAPLGRLLLGAGVALVVMRALELFTRMPGLPAFWYTNQPLWLLIAAGMIGLGWKILWGNSTMLDDQWQPSVPGRRFQTATLYYGEGCHLCDEAKAILAEHQAWLPVAQQINIQSDPNLQERFGTCVPVILFDGKVRFRGKVDPALLQRLIEGSPPQE